METRSFGARVTIAVKSGVGVAERWASQYEGSQWGGTDKEAIGRKLASMGPKPDPNEVEKTIGNKSWTRPYCTVCCEYADAAWEIGNEYACLQCAKTAVSVMEAALAKASDGGA